MNPSGEPTRITIPPTTGPPQGDARSPVRSVGSPQSFNGGDGLTTPRSPQLVPAFQSSFDYDREVRVVHREQVANPAPLGLAGFALTTALLQGANTAITEPATNFFVYATAFGFGGLAQLLAGMWEFKRQNTFGATAFSSYGAFWLSYALYGILVSLRVFQPAHSGEKMFLALWGIYTFILMIPTLELNFMLTALFFTLSVLYFMLAGGVAATVWTRIGGWWGLVVAGIAFYIAAADLINEEYGMTVLPLGKWSVGRPMARALRRALRRVPPFSFLVRGAEREDRLGGLTAKGKKGSAAGKVGGKESERSALSEGSFIYVDVQEESPTGSRAQRRTGHPHLFSNNSLVGAPAFEGAAVRREQRTGDVRSALDY